jgi:hypothetical protein
MAPPNETTHDERVDCLCRDLGVAVVQSQLLDQMYATFIVGRTAAELVCKRGDRWELVEDGVL